MCDYFGVLQVGDKRRIEYWYRIMRIEREIGCAASRSHGWMAASHTADTTHILGTWVRLGEVRPADQNGN